MSTNNNSYIAFELPYEFMVDLHRVTERIQHHIPTFIPMEIDVMHMTVCFLGEVRKRLKSKTKFAELQLYVSECEPIDSLEFKSYELFSIKQNLVVATFDISPQNKEKILALNRHCVAHFGATVDVDYAPHITLGKIPHVNKSTAINLEAFGLSPPETTTLTDLRMILK